MDELTPPLPDREDRARIVTDLDANLLVEAGAGSGKTRALVERMVALVRDRGADVESIAAVTFTRKAASELRERFQLYLEAALADPALDSAGRARLDRALRNVDRAFIGTIHSFCARLLRERPLEAGLDPAFRETLEDEEARLSRRFWDLHVERMSAEGHELLRELDRVGIRPQMLHDLYLTLQGNPDVRFEPERATPPDPAEVAAVRADLERLLRRAGDLIPEESPHDKGPDAVQKRLSRAIFLRRILDWDDERAFFEVLGDLAGKRYNCTYVRWSDDPAVKQRVKALEEDCERLLGPGGAVERLMERWWAHRYPVALRFAREAADAYARHRRMAGWLNFNDLLVLTAELLRTSPRAREDLGRRYRHLLVDEFQDTDPIQAEIVFLLASPPGAGDRWSEVEPRPGQLFVVGDPKQSIYRFRRADMTVYDAVRRRFEDFGHVLGLTANFRSCRAVGDLVNDVFRGEDRFPPEPTPHQARFAPLVPQPRDGDDGSAAADHSAAERSDADARPRPTPGVFHYFVGPAASRKDDIADDDAARLASWIARRTRGAEADRAPGDFMVITWDRTRIESYVRELERRGLPVQVSGARVTAEAELEELMLLLRALTDPGDPVATVAVLSGMFFGLDAERLLVHRESGGRFDFRMPVGPDEEGQPEVVAALQRMEGWWRRGRSEPSDVVVGAIVESLGLVPWAAAGELGQLRAGALLYGLDAVRAAALEGDASLVGALDALEGVLEAREAEASLEPGRRDAVRVMNLHKAKGLEADVVILAAPFAPWDPGPSMHVQRGDDGSRGWVVVTDGSGRGTTMVARPLDWPEREAEERLHDEAEKVRLRYVAATRARDELVVARHPEKDDRSPWAILHPWLDEHGRELDLPAEPAPPPGTLEVEGDAMRAAEREVEDERARRAVPTYAFETVTGRAKKGGAAAEPRPPRQPEEGRPQMDLFAAAPEPPPTPEDDADRMEAAASGDADHLDAAGDGADSGRTGTAGDDTDDDGLHRGADWGSAVHAALEAAAGGATGAVLRSVARAHLLEYLRPVGDDGEPLELPTLLDTVDAVRSTGIWRRAEAAERRLAEVSFTRALPGERVPTWVDGQVDLAFREDAGWVLVDWKTDADPSPRLAAYRRQLRAYGQAWESVTGEPVTERLILFTRDRRVERV